MSVLKKFQLTKNAKKTTKNPSNNKNLKKNLNYDCLEKISVDQKCEKKKHTKNSSNNKKMKK